MASMALEREPLVAGDNLSRDEFLLRWEGMPRLKKAELIEGVVYMPSPISAEHSENDSNIGAWLSHYRWSTPGCMSGANATWLMLNDAPQPDEHLRILEEYGGNNRLDKKTKLLSGAPELAAEVCLSSTSYDLHQKKDLYQRAGVQEYLVVLLHQRELRWFRLVRGAFKKMPPDKEGILRSRVFPGLWLDADAFWAGDMPKVLQVLERGLQSPDHADFVTSLRRRRRRG